MDQLRADIKLSRNSTVALSSRVRNLRKTATAIDQWDTVARLSEAERHLQWAAGSLEEAEKQIDEAVMA